MEALGLIEVKGMLQAIVAADVALKAANVQLTKIEKVKGGLVTVVLNGDVGAIKAAVDAVEHEINSCDLLAKHVIARPEKNIAKLFENEKKEVVQEKVEIEKEEEIIIPKRTKKK